MYVPVIAKLVCGCYKARPGVYKFCMYHRKYWATLDPKESNKSETAVINAINKLSNYDD